MTKPTPRQADILRWIHDFITHNEYSPSLREIADYFSIALCGARDHVAALERKGYVITNQKQARTLRLTSEGKEYLSVNNKGKCKRKI